MGHRFDWILRSEKICERPYRTTWEGSRIWVGANPDSGGYISRTLSMLSHVLHEFKIFRLAKSDDYNIVQVKDRFLISVIGLLAARSAKKKFVFWLSFDYAEDDKQRAMASTGLSSVILRARSAYIRFLLAHVIAPKSDHIFVQSSRMKEDLINLGAESRKITPVPMGVDRNKVIESNEIEINKNCICYLGTLSRTRKIEFLIDVLVHIKKIIPDAYLLLVGSGQLPGDEEFLRTYAKESSVEDSVEITGQLPQNKAWERVQSAAVCVSPFEPTPSLISCSPTKLVEYMALGKASVANDIPDQKDLLENSGGGRCVRYDVTEFSDAIVDLLSNPDVTKEMGCMARDYILAHRTYDRLAILVEDAYRRLLADNATISER